jgi:hypothetical protein
MGQLQTIPYLQYSVVLNHKRANFGLSFLQKMLNLDALVHIKTFNIDISGFVCTIEVQL